MSVRVIKPGELSALTALFDYESVEDMIAENRRMIESGAGDIFCLYVNERLVGELHVLYNATENNEPHKGRAYLSAYRVHKDFRGRGLGKLLLRTVIQRLGYSELTIGVEDDNDRAKHIYECFGFTELLGRRNEEYRGEKYEYNLYLRRSPNLRDFIFICGASGVGKSTLARALYAHYRGALVEQNQAPEFERVNGNEEISGLAEERICWEWFVSTLTCYNENGIKNIVADDFDDLRTADIPAVFKGFDYIIIRLICSDHEQNYRQMRDRGEGLIDFELLEKLSKKINKRAPLVNEIIIDVAGKTPEEVFSVAVEMIGAHKCCDYEYEKPPKDEFYSWVFANGLR
ncbi:MAG: GNAT family N-acetyltransferase [Ruminococcaceae bacterium]|nr:GNAT family N-acetyltransferase [Oscillospiraceae bacterium]